MPGNKKTEEFIVGQLSVDDKDKLRVSSAR